MHVTEPNYITTIIHTPPGANITPPIHASHASYNYLSSPISSSNLFLHPKLSYISLSSSCIAIIYQVPTGILCKSSFWIHHSFYQLTKHIFSWDIPRCISSLYTFPLCSSSSVLPSFRLAYACH